MFACFRSSACLLLLLEYPPVSTTPRRVSVARFVTMMTRRGEVALPLASMTTRRPGSAACSDTSAVITIAAAPRMTKPCGSLDLSKMNGEPLSARVMTDSRASQAAMREVTLSTTTLRDPARPTIASSRVVNWPGRELAMAAAVPWRNVFMYVNSEEGKAVEGEGSSVAAMRERSASPPLRYTDIICACVHCNVCSKVLRWQL